MPEYTLEGYRVTQHDGQWQCECPEYTQKHDRFVYRRYCQHVRAVEDAVRLGKEVQESGPKVVPIRGK